MSLPEPFDPGRPMCRHLEIGEDGMCKICGARAAISLDLSLRTDPPIVPGEIAMYVDNASIFEIDEALDSLLATRQEMLETDPPEDTSAIDVEIIKYFQAGIVKTDRVRGWILHGRHLMEIRKAEAKRLKESAASWEARLDHLEMRLLEYMRSCEPPKKRLSGERGEIIRKTNGGKASLDLYNPSLLPEELCDMVGFLSPAQWKRVPPAIREWLGVNLQRSPNNALIREALAKDCRNCLGKGNFDEQSCQECNGDGQARVPGARLIRGEHIEVK